MKKKLYYVIPFIVVPILMLLCEILDNTGLLNMSPYILCGVLAVSSAVFGFLSPSNQTMDYLLTLIMPLSLFCTMFVVGFLSKSDMGSRFHIYKAFDVVVQPIALILYFAMAIIVSVASLKYFRNLKNRAKS